MRHIYFANPIGAIDSAQVRHEFSHFRYKREGSDMLNDRDHSCTLVKWKFDKNWKRSQRRHLQLGSDLGLTSSFHTFFLLQKTNCNCNWFETETELNCLSETNLRRKEHRQEILATAKKFQLRPHLIALHYVQGRTDDP